jgi:hypothetical protein
MRRIVLLCCTAVLVGCAKDSPPPADTTPAVATTPPPPAPIAVSDVAGKWNVTGKNEAGDSTIVTYVLDTGPDTTKWTITFPNRRPIPVRVVSISGDSIVTMAGPFESVLRKGVQVRTTGPLRIVDGKLVGTVTARYATKRADSVVIIRLEGTRVP